MKKILLALALLTSPALATDFPPLVGKPVIDAADIIPDDQEAALNAKLFAIEKQTHHLVVVMTVKNTQGETPEAFANEAFRYYHLGNKTRNDGVLLLVQPQDSASSAHDHFARIEVGYGLEPTLTDAMSDLIIRNDMAPHFKQGDYVGGINAGVDAIGRTIAEEKVAPTKTTNTNGWWIFGILLVALIGGAWLFLRRKMKSQDDGLSSSPTTPLRSRDYQYTPDYHSHPSSSYAESSDGSYLGAAATAAALSQTRETYSPPSPSISSSSDDDDTFRTSSTSDPSPSFDTSSSDTSSSDSLSSSDFGGSSGGGGATDGW